jgi:hypothetical protein
VFGVLAASPFKEYPMHPDRVPSFYAGERGPERRRSRRKTVENEEAHAWVRFYRRTGDVELASEVLALLESDAQARHEHPALVLLCRESLRRHKAWQQRRRRLAQGVRWLAERLIVGPALALRRWTAGAIDLAIDCMRASRDVSAAKVRHLETTQQGAQRTPS